MGLRVQGNYRSCLNHARAQINTHSARQNHKKITLELACQQDTIIAKPPDYVDIKFIYDNLHGERRVGDIQYVCVVNIKVY